MKEKKRTELSEIGEFGLIDKIRKNVETFNKSTIKGIGDDAAVIAFPASNDSLNKKSNKQSKEHGNLSRHRRDKLLLLSTDMLV